LDDLDDEELENIGLSVSGVDETMLAALSAEQVRAIVYCVKYLWFSMITMHILCTCL
jgi:hypothetical protein